MCVFKGSMLAQLISYSLICIQLRILYSTVTILEKVRPSSRRSRYSSIRLCRIQITTASLFPTSEKNACPWVQYRLFEYRIIWISITWISNMWIQEAVPDRLGRNKKPSDFLQILLFFFVCFIGRQSMYISLYFIHRDSWSGHICWRQSRYVARSNCTLQGKSLS